MNILTEPLVCCPCNSMNLHHQYSELQLDQVFIQVYLILFHTTLLLFKNIVGCCFLKKPQTEGLGDKDAGTCPCCKATPAAPYKDMGAAAGKTLHQKKDYDLLKAQVMVSIF